MRGLISRQRRVRLWRRAFDPWQDDSQNNILNLIKQNGLTKCIKNNTFYKMPPFYRNLKSWRLFKGLTQQELAGRSGISRPNVAVLERGGRECTLSTLNRLSFALGVSPGSLLERQPPLRNSSGLRRHQIDRIARSLMIDKGDLPHSLLEIRDQVAREAEPLLRAAGFKRKRRIRKRLSPTDQKTVKKVLDRLVRLLPHFLPKEAS